MRRFKKPGAAEPEEIQSRSAKKRESTALQKLGEELTELAHEKRERLNLPVELSDALALYDRLRDKEARRRQRQFIGRLMRDVDSAQIRMKLEELNIPTAANLAAQKQAERQRDALLNTPEDRILTALEDLPLCETDMATLQELIGLARTSGSTPNGRRAYREIYRVLLACNTKANRVSES